MTPELYDRLIALFGKVRIGASLLREEHQNVIASDDLLQVINHFGQLDKVHDVLVAVKKEWDGIYDELSHHVIPDRVSIEKQKPGGLKPPYNVEGIGRISVTYRFSCSMIDKDKGKQWLREKGHGGLIQETVNVQTLSAFAKDLIQNQGIELPEDVFKVGTAPYTSITKAK